MPKLITLAASEPHYLDHLLPIWEQLPESVKGDVVFSKEHRLGAEHATHVLLVAGYADVKNSPIHRYVYVEHGAGQSYVGLDRSVRAYYSGGNAHQNCILFLCPNSEVADRWLATYPDKPAVVVGSPRLDPWHAGLRGKYEPRTVAITFHWDAHFTGVPETTSAFGHYADDLLSVIIRWKSQGWHVIGHNHPRYSAVADFWQQPELSALGLEYVANGSEVLDRAAVLVADNTSVQAEFLSLGRPVVWLNHPGYRKDVEHGGRFWTWPRTYGGLVVDDAQSLAAVDLDQIAKPTGHPYAFADGDAASRAASAILAHL